MVAILLRELRSYFLSPVGYVFMGFFLLLTGFFFVKDSVQPANPQFQGVLGSVTFVFLVVVPILTMRLFADERRQRTDQLLMTVPVTITGIVLGKYIAALTVFLLTLIVTLIYPVILSFFGELPVREIIGTYLGFFLLGSTFISVGLLMSSLTDNQVIAAISTFASLLLMWLVDFIQNSIPAGTVPGIIFSCILAAVLILWVFLATRSLFVTVAALVIVVSVILILALLFGTIFETIIIDFLAWFSLVSRFHRFMGGILALSPIVYYLSFSVIMIFLTVRVLERNRWS